MSPKSSEPAVLSDAQLERQRKAALRELPDKFVECRSYRYHSWKKILLFHWRDGSGRGICRVSKCVRCGTEREDYYSRTAELDHRRYTMPAGYSLAGMGMLGSDEVMREYFARAQDIAASNEDADAVARHLSVVGQSGKAGSGKQGPARDALPSKAVGRKTRSASA